MSLCHKYCTAQKRSVRAGDQSALQPVLLFYSASPRLEVKWPVLATMD